MPATFDVHPPTLKGDPTTRTHHRSIPTVDHSKLDRYIKNLLAVPEHLVTAQVSRWCISISWSGIPNPFWYWHPVHYSPVTSKPSFWLGLSQRQDKSANRRVWIGAAEFMKAATIDVCERNMPRSRNLTKWCFRPTLKCFAVCRLLESNHASRKLLQSTLLDRRLQCNPWITVRADGGYHPVTGLTLTVALFLRSWQRLRQIPVLYSIILSKIRSSLAVPAIACTSVLPRWSN
jgi:hypothetical protein